MMERPSYIGLAHELIHAQRIVKGISIIEEGNYLFHLLYLDTCFKNMRVLDWRSFFVSKEDRYVIGIDLPKDYGGITENKIREEHGLGKRMA